MKKSLTAFSIISAAVLFTAGCKKSNNDSPTYDIPTTYNFTNIDYSASTTRLGMVTEISNQLKDVTAGALNPEIGEKLKNMFANLNAPFTNAAYNTSKLQIKDQCFALLQTDVPHFIDEWVAASQSGQPASKGVAGIGTSSANSSSKFVLSATGINYAQVFNKSIMGGLITYQIVNNYMDGMIKGSFDNTTAIPGRGTAMENNWDLAFGYWGVPKDFPSNKTGVLLWGSYSTQVDQGYHANQILMDAFLKGRAAISNKDNKTVQEQATIIMETFERLTAAAALQEVKEVKAALGDQMQTNSRLSECYGFVNSLRYNPKRKITDTQIDEVLALFPDNYYDLTTTDVDAIRDKLAVLYHFEDVKDVL